LRFYHSIMLNIRPASRWKRRGEFLVRTWSICLSMQGSSTSAEGAGGTLIFSFPVRARDAMSSGDLFQLPFETLRTVGQYRKLLI
jgi:hypothetical protein